MSERENNFRRLRVIKWLGFNTLEEHPLARMLHEARASETAREKILPANQRRGYQFRQGRVYASGDKPPVAEQPAAAEPETFRAMPSMVSPSSRFLPDDVAPRFSAAPIIERREPVDHLFEMRSEGTLGETGDDASGRN